ncbi:GNAT family N-acetyltransferase [Rhodospirillum rubrum]|uniref:GNAT family N-acetyltransferase n=1 Tax=Rhodospirillum rubrum TaxID=1085 RepID=UPI0028ADDAD9|nr:GNAT family N-acetyltransferase [Rhodospirillum rubrum]
MSADRPPPGVIAGATPPAMIALAPVHGGVLATLHAAAFTPRDERPWTAEEFVALLGLPGVFGFLAVDHDAPQGFVILRAVADEAEVLTLAVPPPHAGCGVGRRLMGAALAVVEARGGIRVHLEVAEDNPSARALYARLGFTPKGRRRGYYRRGGRLVDAIVLGLEVQGA